MFLVFSKRKKEEDEEKIVSFVSFRLLKIGAPDTFFRTKAEQKAIADTGANGSVVWLQGQNSQELVSEMEDLAGELFS